MIFLGHRIEGGRMMVPDKRVEAKRNYRKPMTKKGTRACLGVVSYIAGTSPAGQANGCTLSSYVQGGAEQDSVDAGD